jgi:hypothetical protein
LIFTSATYTTFVEHFLDYTAEIHEAYREFQAKHPTTDVKAYEKACKPIHDLWKSLQKPVDFTEESKQSTVNRMNTIKEKFTNLVSLSNHYVLTFFLPRWHQAGAYWNMDEILVFGAVLHLGNDVAASHAGTFFAGSDLVKDVVDASGADIIQFMDQLTTACK